MPKKMHIEKDDGQNANGDISNGEIFNIFYYSLHILCAVLLFFMVRNWGTWWRNFHCGKMQPKSEIKCITSVMFIILRLYLHYEQWLGRNIRY